MVSVEIVPPVELWPAGLAQGTLASVEEIGVSWVVLYPDGRLAYERSFVGGRAKSMPIPTVVAEHAAVLLEMLAPHAQKFLDATGQADTARAESALRVAVAAAGRDSVPDRVRVYAIHAAAWIADEYGTRMSYVREADLTADASDEFLAQLAVAEQGKADKRREFGRVVLAGMLPELEAMRNDLRGDVTAATARTVAELTAVEQRLRDLRSEAIRRYAAWGMADREIGRVVGLSHPTVGDQRPKPKAFVRRIRSLVEAGPVWKQHGSEVLARVDGMILAAPAAGGEVSAVLEEHHTVATGVWYHPPGGDQRRSAGLPRRADRQEQPAESGHYSERFDRTELAGWLREPRRRTDDDDTTDTQPGEGA